MFEAHIMEEKPYKQVSHIEYAMTDVKPKIVAVIPCYNTARHIAEVVAKARPYGRNI